MQDMQHARDCQLSPLVHLHKELTMTLQTQTAGRSPTDPPIHTKNACADTGKVAWASAFVSLVQAKALLQPPELFLGAEGALVAAQVGARSTRCKLRVDAALAVGLCRLLLGVLLHHQPPASDTMAVVLSAQKKT